MHARGIWMAFSALLLLSGPATGQLTLEQIPDPIKLPPAEVPYVHPLWKPVDAPAKLLETPKATDFETQTTLYIAVRLDPNGYVVDASAVEAPVRGLNAPFPTLMPKWKFNPAKKAGKPVVTWATVSIDLLVAAERGVFTIFRLLPVEKEEPLLMPVREASGEAWLRRFPKAISPPDPTAVSVEEVDVPPAPDKIKWSWDATRLRSKFTAYVLVASNGSVKKIVPTSTPYESFIFTWLRQLSPTLKVTPAMVKGRPVESWMSLDATLEYTIDNAKDKGRKTMQKNLRAAPVD